MKFAASDVVAALLVLGVSLVIFLVIGIIIFLIPGISEMNQLLMIFAVGMFLLLILSVITIPITMIMLTMLYHKLTGFNEPLNIPRKNKTSWMNKMLSNKGIIVLTCGVVLIASYFYMDYLLISVDSAKYDIGITAHRGSSFEAPENTMAAIRKAYENGATHVEIDVQLTRDGHVILAHDTTFKRTSDLDKRPDELTLEDIKKLDTGAWFSEAYTGEKIPTLQEVMDYAKDKLILNIEIKGSMYSPEIVSRVKALIDKNDFASRCVITSLNYEDLIVMESLDSKIKTGYIMYVAIGDLNALNVDFYSIEASQVSEALVDKAHRFGREVHVWTVNEIDDMETFIALGVDNIITDNDKGLRKLIDSKLKK